MGDTISFEISIPSDDDGYILLQCQHCGTFFKCTVKDLEDDSIIQLHCPSCGLVSESYLTEEVINLASAMAENYAMDMIYNAFKKMEQHNSSKSMIKFSAGQKPKHKSEDPIRTGIDELTVKNYLCCNRSAKIKPILKMSGSFCPFCGVMSFADE